MCNARGGWTAPWEVVRGYGGPGRVGWWGSLESPVMGLVRGVQVLSVFFFFLCFVVGCSWLQPVEGPNSSLKRSPAERLSEGRILRSLDGLVNLSTLRLHLGFPKFSLLHWPWSILNLCPSIGRPSCGKAYCFQRLKGHGLVISWSDRV